MKIKHKSNIYNQPYRNTVSDKNMKIIETLNAVEYNELAKFIKDAVRESINTCPIDYVSEYEDMSFDDYKNNLISEIWDDNEYKGEGIDFISASLIITDDNFVDIESIYEEARDEALEEFCKDYIEETRGHYCDDLTDKLKISEDADGIEYIELEGYKYEGDYETIGGLFYGLLCKYDVNLDEYAGYNGLVKVTYNGDDLYYKKID